MVPCATCKGRRLPGRRPLLRAALLALASLPCRGLEGGGAESPLAEVAAALARTDSQIRAGQATVDALGQVRELLFAGERTELPTVHRHHLAAASPLVLEASHDWKHRAVSTNSSRHLFAIGSILPDVEISHFAFVSLRESSLSVLLAVDSQSRGSVYSQEGIELVGPMFLGHERAIKHLAVTPSTSKRRAVLTADEACGLRLHMLTVRRHLAEGSPPTWERLYRRLVDRHWAPTWLMQATLNSSEPIEVSQLGLCAEGREITNVLLYVQEKGLRILLGDNLGFISVVSSGGELLGSVQVSWDDGGVVGLSHRADGSVLFFTRRSFGLFSVERMDLLRSPCGGWPSMILHVAADIGAGSAAGDIAVAFATGDAAVFSPDCMTLSKFPFLSQSLQLEALDGHVVAMPLPKATTSTAGFAGSSVDLFVLDTAAMRRQIGTMPTRSVVAQATLPQGRYDRLALFALPESVALEADRSEALLALRPVGGSERGLRLMRLSVRHQDLAERLQRRWARKFAMTYGAFIATIVLALVAVWRAMVWLEAPSEKKDAGDGSAQGALDEGPPLDGAEKM